MTLIIIALINASAGRVMLDLSYLRDELFSCAGLAHGDIHLAKEILLGMMTTAFFVIQV
jgi:hypothetical protein